MTRSADLVAAATVGTAHRAVDLAALPEAVRPQPLPAETATALLDAAALSALARRTVPASRAGPVRPPAGPAAERRPVVPDVVRHVLSRVTDQPEILIEALTLVDRAGLRLPPGLLPGLLDDPRPPVVAATRPVSGEIGAYLMAKNPRWTPPAPADPADPTPWEHGTTAERTAWLRALRRVDAAAARDRLADDFDRENAAARARLLAVLADGLSAADQDFLLACVADRSRTVTTVALDLLTRLPDSPYRRDMRALAARHLTIGRRRLRSTITITQPRPQEFSPWPAPESHPWTALLGRIDPTEWPQIFGADLLPLIAAGPDELRPLGPGFRAAALAFRHAGLARVLVSARLAAATRAAPAVDPELWSLLAPIDATELLDRLLGDRRVPPDQVMAVATALPRPWPAAPARRLARWLTDGHANATAPRAPWDLWAVSVALPDCRELADLARAIAARATEDRASALITRAGQAANLLTLRAVLYETLCPPGGHP